MVRECEDADIQAAMHIRFVVFVHEQNVPPELELDEYDAQAIHLLAMDANQSPVGVARVVEKPGSVAKIGRVAVLKEWRGKGVGEALMRYALRVAQQRGMNSAVLDAQTAAIAFYEKLGFVAEGPEFDDAGIAHRRMTRSL
jgi:ElaA protein